MNRKSMMRQLVFLFFTVCSVAVKAQFFFNFPQQPSAQQRQEKYMAPTYKGGSSAIEAFITKNFQQPAEREMVDGKIVIAVIVSPKGKAVEAQVVRSVSKVLNAEAVRVCQKMKFKPATLGKKKVKGRIDITFPIRRGRVSFFDLPTVEV